MSDVGPLARPQKLVSDTSHRLRMTLRLGLLELSSVPGRLVVNTKYLVDVVCVLKEMCFGRKKYVALAAILGVPPIMITTVGVMIGIVLLLTQIFTQVVLAEAAEVLKPAPVFLIGRENLTAERKPALPATHQRDARRVMGMMARAAAAPITPSPPSSLMY